MGSLALFKEGCFPARQREKSDRTPAVLSLGSQGTRLVEQDELLEKVAAVNQLQKK